MYFSVKNEEKKKKEEEKKKLEEEEVCSQTRNNPGCSFVKRVCVGGEGGRRNILASQALFTLIIHCKTCREGDIIYDSIQRTKLSQMSHSPIDFDNMYDFDMANRIHIE